MKKVLLINPYNPEADHIQPPLGLGYLATALKKENIEVIIFDANKFKKKPDKLIKFILKEKPSHVGFQFYTTNFEYIKKSLEMIKKLNPKIITVVGGPHPSALPERTMNDFNDILDFAFCGEAEIGLPELVIGEKIYKEIPGLIFREKENGKENIIVNPPYFHPHLDDFDFPAWDQLKPETYPEAQHGAFFENFPIAPIITTRGCPYNCSFCAGKLNTGLALRKRSVKNIIEEILNLYQNRKIREFHIIDDNFTLDKQFAKDILKEIVKLKLHASFSVPNGVRLDTLDLELLNLMKRAGFYLISVGIESGSDRILKLMNKHLLTKAIKEKIALIKKSGLSAAGFFIIGYPNETEKEIQKTIKFSLALGLLRANFFLFTPLPGTKIYEQLKNEGKINENDINEISFTSPVYSDKVPKNRLKALQKQAFRKFYFRRPIILVRNLLKVKKPAQIVFLLRRAKHWLF